MDVFTLVGKITLDGIKTAEEELGKLQGLFEKNAKTIKAAGIAMTAAGAAITGALALSLNAAAEEEKGIIKLSQALANVGVSYNEVKSTLESKIAATQASTAIADDQQRAALQRLVEITGDYNQSLDLMSIAADLSVAKNMDMGSAAELVGKVAAGNTGILLRYGIVLKSGATATEALGALQAKFAGQAEAYGSTMAGQLANIKNTIGDLMEAIGSNLLPIISDLIKGYVQPAINAIIQWVQANPQLAKTLTIIAAVIGMLLAVLGPLLLMLPGIIAALPILGAVFAALTGPIGLVIAAIAALIAITVLVIKNWDTISSKAREIWEKLVSFFSDIWSGITNIFQEHGYKILAIIFPIIGIPLLIAKNWDIVKTAIADAINYIIDKVNDFINVLNKIPFVNLGAVGTIGVGIPSFGRGGIVPGRIGEPVMAMVHGGETIGRGFTMPGVYGANGEAVNIYVAGSVVTERDLQRSIREAFLDIKNRNTSTGF